MALKLITPSSTEIVSVVEMRRWARIDDDDDSTVRGLVARAVDYAESVMNRQLGRAVYQQTLTGFPCGEILVYMPPLMAVDWIKYYDADDAQQTLDTAVYRVDTHSEPGRIGLAKGKVWPVHLRQLNGVTIQFQAGYADLALIPPQIKQAILAVGKFWFDNGESSRVPAYIDDLLMRFQHGALASAQEN